MTPEFHDNISYSPNEKMARVIITILLLTVSIVALLQLKPRQGQTVYMDHVQRHSGIVTGTTMLLWFRKVMDLSVEWSKSLYLTDQTLGVLILDNFSWKIKYVEQRNYTQKKKCFNLLLMLKRGS